MRKKTLANPATLNYTATAQHTKAPCGETVSDGWQSGAIATVLRMSQQGKQSVAERERMVSPQCGANKTAGLKDRRKKKQFRMGGRAVECDGLENR